MNAIAMVYVVSLSMKHGLNKKLVLLLHVLVCGLSWLWIHHSAFVKGLAKVNQSSANIAQIHESRTRNPRPQDIHMIWMIHISTYLLGVSLFMVYAYSVCALPDTWGCSKMWGIETTEMCLYIEMLNSLGDPWPEQYHFTVATLNVYIYNPAKMNIWPSHTASWTPVYIVT